MRLLPWLAQRGFVSKYADVFDLPYEVLEDAELVDAAESQAQTSDATKAKWRSEAGL